ncbi:Putative endoglucanase [Rubripirellula lacrimiformis]|uniref:Endoglucanase n=1 Tax=Rubripirellula lacrimiformis TaxID=1930273 RepID=A0A517NK84_9BACT|nr:DUF5060 domain-containing protein [Rubripirellula lacrimiformis]QDT07552.1 Putative endoglucanase [Rubripirellula lacrimiformis]
MKYSLAIAAAFTFLPLVTIPVHALDHAEFSAGQAILAGQWDVIDIRFRAECDPSVATDVALGATFTDADGNPHQAAGFYNGQDQFVIRFTPPSAGEWTFATQSSLSALDGKNGKMSVQTARPNRKGGIIIDPEQATRFRYQNGDSYYPIAFESDWLFALDAQNADDIPDTRKLVDSLAANGFNQVVMNVFAYDVNWKKDDRLVPEYEYGSPSVYPFGGNNDEPDHSKLNIEYFRRLDRVVDYLDQKGIAAHLMIYVWNKQVHWPEANSDADNRYFDYVVQRYQAFPNIVWDVSKEALGYGHSDVDYITQRIKRLRDRDQFERLITVHDYSYCRRFTENVDFVSVQLWSSELHSVMRNVCEAMPNKPILNIEHGGYEKGPYVVFTGNYTSPETCLERAYQCVFAGTFPTHYWQGAAWNVIIPDIDAMPAKQRPRLDYYRHMRTLVDRYDLGQLTAGDKNSNAGFSLHNGNDLYVYYVPKECEYIGMRLPKSLTGQTMTGTWFNPFDGSFSKPDVQEIVQWPAFTKPAGDGFRVLIVEIQPKSGDTP